MPWQEKVRFLAAVATDRDCAIRVGVNCDSEDPAKRNVANTSDTMTPMLESAHEHCEFLDSIGFTRYCVSLKDSNRQKVIEVNRRFAAARPDVPLHLGVTESGIPPDSVIKTRIALGVNESIDILRFSFDVGTNTFGDVIAALESGLLQIGLHVRSIGSNGDSDSFLDRPNGVIPELGTILV